MRMKNIAPKCTCHISYCPKPDHIVYCPKHKAAPDMYEALEDLAACFRNIEILSNVQNEGEKYSLEIAINSMTKALAKAEGKC